MLPYDCARCEPVIANEQCKECARYSFHPEQTFGPRTAVMIGVENTSGDCKHFVEIKDYMKKGK